MSNWAIRNLCLTVKTSFYAYHSWPEAPMRRSYLRIAHPHMFNVEVTVGVPVDSSRSLEFHDLVDLVNHVTEDFKDAVTTLSCEQFATLIAQRLMLTEDLKPCNALEVLVGEDARHSATVRFSK